MFSGGGVNIGEQLSQGSEKVGQGISTGTQSGGWIGAIIGGVIGAVDAGFSWGAASKDAKAQKERDRTKLIDSLTGDDGKVNVVPVVIIGSVLLVGAVVIVLALNKKI